jgi:hypothetical protein
MCLEFKCSTDQLLVVGDPLLGFRDGVEQPPASLQARIWSTIIAPQLGCTLGQRLIQRHPIIVALDHALQAMP